MPVYMGAAGAVLKSAGLLHQLSPYQAELQQTHSEPVGVGPAYPILLRQLHHPHSSTSNNLLGREGTVIRIKSFRRYHLVQPLPKFRWDLFPFMPSTDFVNGRSSKQASAQSESKQGEQQTNTDPLDRPASIHARLPFERRFGLDGFDS